VSTEHTGTPHTPGAPGRPPAVRGLSLRPFRAARYHVDDQRLGRLLCPPYDVIDETDRARMLAADECNAVRLILPQSRAGGDAYQQAADDLDGWISTGLMRVDAQPALYVYEMATPTGGVTRGLMGSLELRDYDDGVILPHENTMAGPVADRLALMTATHADLEPIYLVYDGGGPASASVLDASSRPPIAETTTPDGTTHRLWGITDPSVHEAVAADLNPRRALIADGHHRYATYLELQRRCRAARGPGAWDCGLALLVDSSSYGPQVHAIHRVLNGVPIDRAIMQVARHAHMTSVPSAVDGLAGAGSVQGFAAVLTDGQRHVLIAEPLTGIPETVPSAADPAALLELDVVVLHRQLLGPVWGLADTAETVGYAHDVDEAVALAQASGGTAVLLRPTPVTAVAAIAGAGARMPRKSTLFTPKPATGIVIRRFHDQT
jgi:uncharacterized protein (DUF1015 family)